MHLNFIFSKDDEEKHMMHPKSDNIKLTSYNNANEIVDELFEPIHSRYQENLETSMRGSHFIFDSIQMMYYKCHEVNFRRGGSYIDCPDWIKKEKATANPKNKDHKCFQYEVTVALIYEEIELHPERVPNIKPFIINYPSNTDDWKTFKKNNPTIALDILYSKEKEKYPDYISKINSNCGKNNSIDDSKQRKRRLGLSCRKKTNLYY